MQTNGFDIADKIVTYVGLGILLFIILMAIFVTLFTFHVDDNEVAIVNGKDIAESGTHLKFPIFTKVVKSPLKGEFDEGEFWHAGMVDTVTSDNYYMRIYYSVYFRTSTDNAKRIITATKLPYKQCKYPNEYVSGSFGNVMFDTAFQEYVKRYINTITAREMIEKDMLNGATNELQQMMELQGLKFGVVVRRASIHVDMSDDMWKVYDTVYDKKDATNSYYSSSDEDYLKVYRSMQVEQS